MSLTPGWAAMKRDSPSPYVLRVYGTSASRTQNYTSFGFEGGERQGILTQRPCSACVMVVLYLGERLLQGAVLAMLTTRKSEVPECVTEPVHMPCRQQKNVARRGSLSQGSSPERVHVHSFLLTCTCTATTPSANVRGARYAHTLEFANCW